MKNVHSLRPLPTMGVGIERASDSKLEWVVSIYDIDPDAVWPMGRVLVDVYQATRELCIGWLRTRIAAYEHRS